MGVDFGKAIRHLIHTRIADVDDKVSGIYVTVPFYNQANSTVDGETIYFELDALGATIRNIFVSFYLPLHLTATFTPRWYKTRPNDLITFTLELIPALVAIGTPGANAYYSYYLGDLAQGLQGSFRIHQSNHAALVSVDAWLVAEMVV